MPIHRKTFRKLYFELLDYEAGPLCKRTRPTLLAKGSRWVGHQPPTKKPKKRKYGHLPFQA
jgi:hypothetical protein